MGDPLQSSVSGDDSVTKVGNYIVNLMDVRVTPRWCRNSFPGKVVSAVFRAMSAKGGDDGDGVAVVGCSERRCRHAVGLTECDKNEPELHL